MTFFAKNQRIAGAAITFTQAVRTTTSGHATPATANLPSIPFDGIALSSASTNNTVYIEEQGSINPTIFNLGDGYACAVGTTVSGFPVRATDPTCVSAPNWVGYCDTHGTITVRPKREERFDPRDFGAVWDGVTDDLAAWNAMFTVAPRGATIWIPLGTSYVSDNLLPDKAFIWQGSATNGAFIKLAPGKKIHLRSASQIGQAFATDYSRFQGFTLRCQKVSLAEWQANHTYTVGTRIRVKLGDLNVLNDTYQEDMGVHFVCKVGGATAGSQPNFLGIPGQDTTDGYVTWTCENWSGFHIQSTSNVFDHVNVDSPTDSCFSIQGFSSDVTIADAITIRDCGCFSADGNGIDCSGDDANACNFVGNTIISCHRGAMIRGGFLSSVIIGNNGQDNRRSYVGTSGSAQTVWLGNYFEADCAPYKILFPQLWLSGQNSNRAPESTCVAFNGVQWTHVPAKGFSANNIVVGQTIGGDPGAFLGFLERTGDYYPQYKKLIDDDVFDPGGYYRKEWAAQPHESSDELTAERSIWGPYRRRFPQGFYLGRPVSGSKNPIWISSDDSPPAAGTYNQFLRTIWYKSDLVFNQVSDGYVAPGWIAARRGGWGGGRFYTGRIWVSGASLICQSDGIEPSTPNGKVFRLNRFEIFTGGVWDRDDRLFATLSSTEPTWPTVDGDTVTELLDSTHRILWECWGDVGMTWAEMPIPTTFVYT